MKIFKTVDEKLEELGFLKVSENKYGAEYVKENKDYGYTQKLDIKCKKDGNHLILSYEKGVNGDGFNNAIGLTITEAKLAYKKFKQLAWKYNW